MITADERQLGRAKNAVMFYLERTLIVPKIYVDADWGGNHADVLAIDRDGVGDVHSVLFAKASYVENRPDFNELESSMNHSIDQLMLIPANYKYIVVVAPEKVSLTELSKTVIDDRLFSSDGLGRIGLLLIGSVTDSDTEIKPVVLVKPERFRAKIAKLADEYVQQHEADWEIRA